MAGGFKKFIDKLNQPIGKNGTSDKKKQANLALKTMELTPKDAIKNSPRITAGADLVLTDLWVSAPLPARHV